MDVTRIYYFFLQTAITTRCKRSEFQCNDGTCISNDYKCDGYEDCSEYEDERPPVCECDKNTQFTCKDKGLCISNYQKCDKHMDCSDGSDEDPALCNEL